MTDKELHQASIEIARKLIEKNPELREWAESKLPELKESDDEKTRKELIDFFNQFEDGIYRGVDISSWISWLKKQGEQKSAEKIKPKFKVGDCIVDKDDCGVFHVAKVLDNTYEIIDVDGDDYHIPHYTVETGYRLWAIQDAEDGDVIFVKPTENLGKQLIIFGGIDSNGRIKYYCRFLNNKFSIGGGLMGYDHKYFLPATKEQRDLLFQKMIEAGYEWDSEKLEVRKIENKSAEWRAEDEHNLNVCLIYINDDWLCRWLKNVIHVRYDKPTEWNEEDEVGLGDALWAIEQARTIAKDENDMGNLWYAERWLKSLKDRYTWKPSDEQMVALQESIGIVGQLTPRGEYLKELAEQLKKLR